MPLVDERRDIKLVQPRSDKLGVRSSVELFAWYEDTVICVAQVLQCRQTVSLKCMGSAKRSYMVDSSATAFPSHKGDTELAQAVQVNLLPGILR